VHEGDVLHRYAARGRREQSNSGVQTAGVLEIGEIADEVRVTGIGLGVALQVEIQEEAGAQIRERRRAVIVNEPQRCIATANFRCLSC